MPLITTPRPTLGVIDSGTPPGMALARFGSSRATDEVDRLGHGRAILATLGHSLPLSRLEIALYKLFEERLTADAAALAAAFEWHAESPPTWLLCSLGLPRADTRLQAAVARLQAAGTRIIAASPRFGAPVYPAAWPGVVAVSGAAGLLPGPPAPDTPPALGGASFAAAHALGYWLAESADDGAGVPGEVAAKGSAGQSG